MSWIVSHARALAILAAALLAASVAACNTVEGVGEDMQSGGRAIERSADDAKR
jgi:entericidin B